MDEAFFARLEREKGVRLNAEQRQAVSFAKGMALLAAYMVCREAGESLGDYLNNKVFAGAKGSTLAPDPEDVKGFEAYLQNYVSGLAAEEAAVR